MFPHNAFKTSKSNNKGAKSQKNKPPSVNSFGRMRLELLEITFLIFLLLLLFCFLSQIFMRTGVV